VNNKYYYILTGYGQKLVGLVHKNVNKHLHLNGYHEEKASAFCRLPFYYSDYTNREYNGDSQLCTELNFVEEKEKKRRGGEGMKASNFDYRLDNYYAREREYKYG